jgi:hypothetical protein
VTGDKLSKQIGEGIYSIRNNAKSGESGLILPLGNIKGTSRVEFQIAPRRVWGDSVQHEQGQLSSNGGSCGNNCINADFYCDLETNIFSTIDTSFSFDTNFEKEFDRIFVIINEKEFLLRDLIGKDLVKYEFVNGNLHINIDDLSKIIVIDNVNESVISFKILPINKNTFNGHKLIKMGGPYGGSCIRHFLDMARHFNWPVSVESQNFGSWQHQVNWNILKRGDNRQYLQQFSVGISAIVKNFYN